MRYAVNLPIYLQNTVRRRIYGKYCFNSPPSIGSGFARFRVGIGMKPDSEVNLADYVLSKLNSEEWALLQARKDYLCQSLSNLLDDGVDIAMNLINQINRSPEPS